MKQHDTPPDDHFQIRCPRLGHQIYFSYCRTENFGLPCFKTLDCWFRYFKVEEFLRRELTPDEWHDAFEKPIMPKALSLADLIEQAKKRVKTE